MLVDSHCHLDFPDFDDDMDGVLARAAEAGVGLMLTICTHVTRFDQVRTLAVEHDQIYCTVGIHPHNAESEPECTAEHLVRLADHPKVVGLGETGLDYFYEHASRESQQRSFRAHIEAARRTGLPVVIHSRDADDDMMAILEDEHRKGAFPGLVHCFSSGPELAEKAVNLGLYISLSGIVTFNKADSLRETVRGLPLDRLLVETDSPYLAPVPKRGKRNEPAFTAHTADRLAIELQMDQDRFYQATTYNFLRLFSKIPAIEQVA
ncbi:TatD family hydrolase [Magnetospira sp. QH-2]|uniref:TatD family hydrolase n=1 Tax=Magnetospira sp. (strain QH-2) TaxID=1288970 RepID=UPI0005FA7DE7|nr:TatD family hydrolase [Magnetospira sp. QH-2]